MSPLVLRPGSASWEKAEQAGLKVKPVADAAAEADIVMMLVPDELAPDIYATRSRRIDDSGQISCVLARLFYSLQVHRTAVRTRTSLWSRRKVPAILLRLSMYAEPVFPACSRLIRIQPATTKAVGLAYASAIGGGRAGVIETTFREETETDLFGEQAVLCGGLTSLIKAGFETLIEAGYSPEMAYFECLHEMKLIVDLVYEGGISEMRYSISNTAQYGDMTRGPVVVNDETKRRMKSLLAEIQSGAFARDWMKESRNGRPRFNQLDSEAREHPIEQVGARLRQDDALAVSWATGGQSKELR